MNLQKTQNPKKVWMNFPFEMSVNGATMQLFGPGVASSR